MASELIYYCDPEKNTKCKKRSCFSGSARWQSCRYTRDIESAQTDQNGIPMIYGLKFEGGVESERQADGPDQGDHQRTAE